MEESYLSIMKFVYGISTANILYGQNLKALLMVSRTRQECLLSPLLFNIVLEV